MDKKEKDALRETLLEVIKTDPEGTWGQVLGAEEVFITTDDICQAVHSLAWGDSDPVCFDVQTVAWGTDGDEEIDAYVVLLAAEGKAYLLVFEQDVDLVPRKSVLSPGQTKAAWLVEQLLSLEEQARDIRTRVTIKGA